MDGRFLTRLAPWTDQPGRTILGSNDYRPGVRCDGRVKPEDVRVMRDYNVGVPGYLAVKRGDRLQALYYCGGDACEREGWCYAQPSMPQGLHSCGGWLPQRVLSAPHRRLISLAVMPFVPLLGYDFLTLFIPVLALLKSLQGSWKDQYGTEYDLKLSEEGTTLAVCTWKYQKNS